LIHVPTVNERIRHAQALIASGDKKAAATELTDAAVECRDPIDAAEIRQLAEREMDAAGRFGKGRWKEIIRIADLHGAGAGTAMR
jgi:hypothetical protein